MLAILVVIGDQICVQFWFKRGPNMPAISVSIGTIYAYNLDYF